MSKQNAAPAAGFDLDTDLDLSEKFARVEVAHDADGKATAGFIIASRESEQYRAVTARNRQQATKRGAVKSTRIDTKTDEGAREYDELLRRNEFETAVAVVVDVFGFTTGGKPASFSEQLVRDLLTKRDSWKSQVLFKLESESDFLPLSQLT
ncbi:MAG: hypothetical protein EON92_06245 [Burkholderiales bacterium]|nr:MAG: hypothetical protein EON92_06245 [Burkholderiales bacterium]